jgi:hypothetical protein
VKSRLDLGAFLRGGRDAQKAVDFAIAAHGRAPGGALLEGVEVSTTPKRERLTCHECRLVVVLFPGNSSAEHQLPGCAAWKKVETGAASLEQFLGDCGHPSYLRFVRRSKLHGRARRALSPAQLWRPVLENLPARVLERTRERERERHAHRQCTACALCFEAETK